MKIRSRLTLFFSLVTGVLHFFYAGIIYIAAKDSREKEFYSLLKKEALTKANLFFDAKVDTQTLQDIYSSNRQTLNEVEVAIYDKDFNLMYHDAVDIDFVKETPEMIDKIYNLGEIQFYQEDWQVVGIKYLFEEENYLIVAAAYDEYGFTKLNSLLKNSSIIFICAISFIYFLGFYFSKKALDPVREITLKAKKISAINLDLRLNKSNENDELSELANTFNEMLDRLENSFEAQKNFVSNISHELRTPLSAMIAELELSLQKEKTIEEYKNVIRNVLNDTKKLVRLSNGLLDLAKASYDTNEITFKSIRLDETLLDATQQIQHLYPDYKIIIQFSEAFDEDDSTDEEKMLINGNEYLLKVAFMNLMENACKFSDDNQCIISISFDNENTILQFEDKGIGISKRDLPNLFTPFFRGKNSQYAEGNGIGLYLTQKIVQLHNAQIKVNSKPKKGSTFQVNFK